MSVLTHEARSRTGPLAWLLVSGIVLAALNLRTAVTSVGPLLDRITDALQLTGVTAGLLTTLPVLCFATVGAITPALARRLGEHRLLLIALLALGAGLLTRVLVDSAGVFLLASAVALSGGAIGNVLIPALIKRHFPRRTGTMTTVYTTALAIGTMMAAAATVPIERAADGDWHVALGVWAALATVSALPWILLLRSEPARDGNALDLGPRTLVRSRLAWSVAAYFGTQSLVAYVMFGWLAQMLIDKGHTAGQAGFLLAVFTALGIPIAIAVPMITSRLADQRPIVVGLAVLYTIGFTGLWLAPDATAWVWVVAIGLGMGSFPLALTMLALRTRSAEATAALSAFGQSVGYLLAGAGPLVVGVLYGATGGWTAPLLLLLGVVVAQLVTGWHAGSDRYLEDEPSSVRQDGGHENRRIDQDHVSGGGAVR
ncbi:MFS transporter [Spongiactinospora sp. TRM90649]|uniref:CynX/NimT family MFS transporter n=1 Tax=Spongiactinospora sp. TRM90649 TaxID=3031114 RepID=UPI0023F9E6C6|nr:MFS transporter [Spongiactinospora sp. TRM90649]MDF5755292.1 MFS transporter [Spongiactinospora sp. TRM90649]